MPTINAQVPTAEASRLIQRLCKHFRHKIDAEWDAHQGRLHFSIGECRLDAEPDALHLRCDAASADELAELGEVVASHLVRFAGDSVESVEWQAASSIQRPPSNS
ncbi:DUF2218 domain-containing protein [Halomonas sp. Y3]|uniref:DUF2218 domain-containing protein n=1 Tax=Halomonas sp. Y3 TaxID=2956797 RepID=UPI00209C82BF|nr:DUF2218 domain-containing protein [Halomonas sp. Y3]